MRALIALLPPHKAPDGYYEAACAEAKRLGHDLLGLYVVDAVWFRFSGADWLSTGPSRADFDAYMRATLRTDGEEILGRLGEAAENAGLSYAARVVEGDPAAVTAAVTREPGADAVFVPKDHPALGALLKSPPCRIVIYTPGGLT